MQITLRHTLRIELDEPLSDVVFALRPTASQFNGQDIEAWAVAAPGLETAPHVIDGFGNVVRLITLPQVDDDDIVLQITGKVQRTDTVGVVKGLSEAWRPDVYRRQTEFTKLVPAVAKKISEIKQDSPLALMHAWNEVVHESWLFAASGDGDREKEKTAATNVDDADGEAPKKAAPADGDVSETDNPKVLFGTELRTVGDVVQSGGGDATELAQRFIAGARHMSLPARFVTGYVARRANEDDPETNGDVLVSGRHAWAEVWIQGLGWVGFDPVLNQCPTDTYVRLTCGLDAAGAALLRAVPALGTLGPVIETVEVTLANTDSDETSADETVRVGRSVAAADDEVKVEVAVAANNSQRQSQCQQ